MINDVVKNSLFNWTIKWREREKGNINTIWNKIEITLIANSSESRLLVVVVVGGARVCCGTKDKTFDL